MCEEKLIDKWYGLPNPREVLGAPWYHEDRKCTCCGQSHSATYLRVDEDAGIICDKCFFIGVRCVVPSCNKPKIRKSFFCRSHYIASDEIFIEEFI